MPKKSPHDPFDPVAFGARIKERRRTLDLRQAALADRTGIEVSALSPYENGLRLPSDPSVLVRLARALEVSVDWLLTGRETRMTVEELADYERGRLDALRRVQRVVREQLETPATPESAGASLRDDDENGEAVTAKRRPRRTKEA